MRAAVPHWGHVSPLWPASVQPTFARNSLAAAEQSARASCMACELIVGVPCMIWDCSQQAGRGLHGLPITTIGAPCAGLMGGML